MRESIAKVVCAFMVGVVVALSWLFARQHNPPMPGNTEQAGAVAPSSTVVGRGIAERGRALYGEQNCATCHSIDRVGNPRHPLDGVGARLGATEMRAWITATGNVAAQLPAAAGRRKQRYQELSANELDALVAYLSLPAGR